MAKFDKKLKSGCFGYEGPMGIPDYDMGVEKASLTPEKNKFSWMQMSQDEVMRAVKGKGTSKQSMKGTESSSVRRMYETD